MMRRTQKKGMEWVPSNPAVAAVVRDAVRNTVIPSWVKRAGPDGKPVFNQYIAPYAGFTIP